MSSIFINLLLFLSFLAIIPDGFSSIIAAPVPSALILHLLWSYFLLQILICVMGLDALLCLLWFVPVGLVVEGLVLAC